VPIAAATSVLSVLYLIDSFLLIRFKGRSTLHGQPRYGSNERPSRKRPPETNRSSTTAMHHWHCLDV